MESPKHMEKKREGMGAWKADEKAWRTKTQKGAWQGEETSNQC